MDEERAREFARQAASGDMDALEALIGECHGYLFALLNLSRVGESEIEDVAQNVFVEMYRSLSRYDLKQRFKPWFKSVALNVVRNHWRSQKRARNKLNAFEQYVRQYMSGEVELEESVELQQLHLRQCVERLQSHQRQLVTLRYVDGLDSGQIGERMQIGAATVRQTLVRVRNVLRLCVQSAMAIGAQVSR